MLIRGETTVPIPIPFDASILTTKERMSVIMSTSERLLRVSREHHSNIKNSFYQTNVILISHFYFLRSLRVMESILSVQIRKMRVLGLDGKAGRRIEYHSSSCSKWQWYPPICV